MTPPRKALHAGFIPLVDAAALLVAVDKGFAAAEGLDITLVREVSWANIRDKLNIGLFDAAHLLAPVAIASSLGLGQVKEPIAVPLTLAVNGNAITVSPPLMSALQAHADGDLATPMNSARTLARVIAARRKAGQEPLTFGMTFPFSAHDYMLRFWMAAGGIDPDDDVRLVVLPPPYMVDSLARGQVDAFCVGAPWNSVAVEMGIGHILHCGTAIFARAVEKVLALRDRFSQENPETVAALVRAVARGANYVATPEHHDEVAALLARADRVGVAADIIKRTLSGHMRLAPGGALSTIDDYLLIDDATVARPDPDQAAWLYTQMARWKQTRMSDAGLATARAVFRPGLFDAAIGDTAARTAK